MSLILQRFAAFPPGLSDKSKFAGLLPIGDILVDDRPRLSLGRKLVDLRQLGVPWILIAKVLNILNVDLRNHIAISLLFVSGEHG